MRPGLDREIRLGVKADAEDHDSEEACNVAGKLPILPFTRLTGRRRSPIEEVSLRLLLVARRRPSARSGSCGPGTREEPVAEHGCRGGQGLWRRHGAWFPQRERRRKSYGSSRAVLLSIGRAESRSTGSALRK